MQEQRLWRYDSGNEEKEKEMSTVHELEQRIKVLESLLGHGVDHLSVDNNGYLKIDNRYNFTPDTLDLTAHNIDVTQSNNGISSGVRYPSTQNILDSHGRILSRVEGVVVSNGDVGFNIYANNYNSSGQQIGRAGIQGYVDKSGNVSYQVNSPDKFRAALNLGSMATINSPVPIDKGGTGQTSAASAFTALSGLTLDINTNNTSDTWMPVMKNSIVQHRVVPRNLTYDFSVQSGEMGGNSLGAYGQNAFTRDVSGLVSGYNYSINNIWTNNYGIVPIRAYQSGNTITMYFKNIENKTNTFTIYYSLMRWKVAA